MEEDRKIRYRVKNKDDGSKVETLIVTLRDLESGRYSKYFDIFDYDVLSREESTTESDKNNKEIFEGDKVKHEKYPDNIYEMVWYECGFIPKLIGKEDYLLCDGSDLEVI